MCPYSWKPGETHFAGPGVEIADGDLIHAGTVYHGHGLQPGGSFVVRRMAAGEEPTWVFRTDRKATDLDHDMDNVYVTYADGEIVGLDLRDGDVRWRRYLAVAGVPVVATALTVTGPGRLLIGTTDGRLLDCSAVQEVPMRRRHAASLTDQSSPHVVDRGNGMTLSEAGSADAAPC